jgi:hypothetical protein
MRGSVNVIILLTEIFRFLSKKLDYRRKMQKLPKPTKRRRRKEKEQKNKCKLARYFWFDLFTNEEEDLSEYIKMSDQEFI